jgi:hypothetical protein
MKSPEHLFSFTDWARSRPNAPIPGDRLDLQFQELIRAIKATQRALSDIRADDGKLKRGIVSDDHLVPRIRDRLITDLTTAIEPLRASVRGTYTSTIASEHQAELYARDAEAAARVAAQLMTGMEAIRRIAQSRADYVTKVSATTSSDATDAENWANYSQAEADNAILAANLSLQWAEYLAGPVVDGTNAPAYIAGSAFPHGLYYQPVEGGLAGLWSAKWWALYAQQLVGKGSFYYLGGTSTPPTPGGQNPNTGQPYPNPFIPGSLYYNTSTNILYVWNGQDWVIQQQLTAAIGGTYVYYATANQTVFSGPDVNNSSPVVGSSPSRVHVNGLLLAPGDYHIDPVANTLTLNTPASAGSVVQWDLMLPQNALHPGAVNIFKVIAFAPNGTVTDFPIKYYDPTSGQPTNAIVNSNAEIVVVLDGVEQQPGTDFTTSNDGTASTLHMATAPPADADFWAEWYQPQGEVIGVAGPVGPAGPQGPAGIPGPTAISANTPNLATLGSDNLTYVPDAAGDGNQYVRQSGAWTIVRAGPTFATVAAVQAATIAAGTAALSTRGYYANGDGGGANYIFAPTQSGAMDGNIQSADGKWWQYVPETRGVNCKSFGAKPDAADNTPAAGGVYGPVTLSGTDNTPFIQAAINFAIRNKVRTVFLPCGWYRTAGTLHLGWGDSFYSVDLEGDSKAYAMGMGGTLIMFSATNGCQCINVSGARFNVIRGIQFYYPQNYYYVFNNIANVRPSDPLFAWGPLPASPSAWVDPAIANGLAVNAPVAAITVDGFAGAQPSPSYPAVVFPSWTGLSSQYSKNTYSSNVQVRNCYFKGWPVAYAVGVNTVNQGDFTVVTDCHISHGAFGISINNSQSRNVEIKNIYFAFMNTVLDNASFGSKNGEWGGPISNLSGGESFQIFNFNATLALGIEISHVYSEGGLRRLGVWNAYQGLKLYDWCVSFSDSQYEASRALVECPSFATVTFNGCQLGTHYGIQNLVYGASARAVIGDGNYFTSGNRFTGPSIAGYQAQAYGGGFIINGGAAYPASQNKVRGASATYVVTPGGHAYTTWADDEAVTYSTNYVFMYRDGMTAFRDWYARRWCIKQTTPYVNPLNIGGTIRKSGGGSPITGMSQTGETLTFTYTYNLSSEFNYGYNNWGFAVGDILIDQPSGAILVVTSKVLTSGSPPPATNGVYTITAVQQNCYNNYPGGSWTSTASPPVTNTAGNFQIVRTNTQFSQQVFFGDFTAGSPNVANIHTGNLDGSAAATYLLSGTLLFAPGPFNHAATIQMPITTEFPVRENTYIGTVTNGGNSTTPATMTLVAADGTTPVNAINTGRYPISPLALEVAAPPAATIVRANLAGLVLSTTGSSTTFTVAPGSAANSTNIDTITLTTSLNKITAAWAAGNNQGGLDTGAIANSTWYHIHLIKRTDTQVVDALVSLSPTAPTLPANYTEFRRIGSLRTNASGQWTGFVQNGDEFLWTTMVNDINAVAITATPALATLTVPTGLQVWANINAAITATATSSLLLNSPDETAQAATATNATVRNVTSAVAAPINAALIRTNTSAQIRAVSDGAAGAAYSIYTRGWIDHRGRDN